MVEKVHIQFGGYFAGADDIDKELAVKNSVDLESAIKSAIDDVQLLHDRFRDLSQCFLEIVDGVENLLSDRIGERVSFDIGVDCPDGESRPLLMLLVFASLHDDTPTAFMRDLLRVCLEALKHIRMAGKKCGIAIHEFSYSIVKKPNEGKH